VETKEWEELGSEDGDSHGHEHEEQKKSK